MADINAQETYEAQRIYTQFFDDNAKYTDLIKSLVSNEEIRLIVDLNDLRGLSDERVEKLMKNSFIEISACQKALKTCISNIDVVYSNTREEFFVGFEGSFGARHLNPRSLQAAHLGNMVCIEGIVTRMSCMKAKLERSVHYCRATSKFSEKRYSDMTSLEPYPSSGAYPTKDDQGNVLQTEFGLCSYKDHQVFTIQEMPEHTPAGQLPRFTEVVLEHDLVDKCKAGDRVFVTGQYRQLPGKKGGFTTAIFRSVIIANNVYPLSKQMSTNFDEVDMKNILALSKKKDILDILTRSIAPSIYGHEYVKRAILCQMLGGVERILANGTRIRGDINLLLLGDPSVAKSQFLRFVLQCARDRAIATTGRGSSGVGLTAAVVSDRESGERTLEAGAMVLADRGIVCIDEFDKMSDIDRTAIHEVMEQGRVTIAKAGIHAKLNARCSVLAAANPVFGRYDQYKTPHENIALQDSLLSRFDLLFIMLDTIDEDADRVLAEFVLKVHQYRAPGEEDGYALPLQGTHNVELVGGMQHQAGTAQMFENTGDNTAKRYLTKSFLEKYLKVARQLKPKLSLEASKLLAEKYSDLRSQESAGESGDNRHRTQPVTARTMETMIRLATAHAKAHLKKVVSRRDAEAAADLVMFVMFREVLKKASKRQRPGDDESEGESEAEEVHEAMEVDTENVAPVAAATNKAKRMKTALSDADFGNLTKWVSDVFSSTHESDLGLGQVVEYVRTQSGNTFSESMIRDGLSKLHEMNRLMVTEDQVYMI